MKGTDGLVPREVEVNTPLLHLHRGGPNHTILAEFKTYLKDHIMMGEKRTYCGSLEIVGHDLRSGLR